MSAIFPAAAWSALVVALAWQHRPAPKRVRALVSAPPSSMEQSGAVTTVITGLIERVGRAGLRLLRRPEAPGSARRVGWGVLAGAGSLLVFPPVAAVVLFAGFALPTLRKRSDRRRRSSALLRHLPEVVDLMHLAAGAGLNVSLAVSAVARRAPSPFAEELTRAAEEAAMGRRLADALEDVVGRTDEVVRPLISALVAAERYGAPLSETLGRLADEVRGQRRRRAEEAARRVPVKLLFPLVLCILPAFGLLTMAPVLAGAFKALRL
ncbi:MAG: type II secretion system F family protein [Actinobacteria bacterium]|nr:type II secretion system F family protein [Actinomycetota bacterium]